MLTDELPELPPTVTTDIKLIPLFFLEVEQGGLCPQMLYMQNFSSRDLCAPYTHLRTQTPMLSQSQHGDCLLLLHVLWKLAFMLG